MDSNVVELVKGLSQGPCGCYYAHSQGGWGYDAASGEIKTDFRPGPKTECLRCRARRALEADGIDYERVDHLPLRVSL